MKNKDLMIKSAVTGILALATVTTIVIPTATLAATQDMSGMEKCYGIVKAELNDCQTLTQSCAGYPTKDKQPDAFIFLPKGVCNKIVGGNLTTNA